MWVGSGENNSQRSVAYGDGVYRSTDGGVIVGEPGAQEPPSTSRRSSSTRATRIACCVAAQGPLWAPGGDRGLYETTDGGKTWKAILTVDENTGVTDVVRDPRDPDLLYAATYQRRRHVWTLIDGGPGSAIWKSPTAARRWKKLENGLPKEDMGRIGLAVAPSKPDVVYAIIEAAEQGGRLLPLDRPGRHRGRSEAPTSPRRRSTTRRSSSTRRSRRASTRWTPGCR